MKNIRYSVRFACAAALLLAACATDEEAPAPAEGAVVHPVLSIGVSEMTMTAEPAALSDAETRAHMPMSPDVEKYVRTIAAFEFDNEGLHIKGGTTYHFIDFVAGTIDGVKTMEPIENGIVQTDLSDSRLTFEAREDGTLCLVANVTEAQVDEFYEQLREPGQSIGRMTLDRFKMWALPFEYEQETEGTYNETTSGHIKVMYMFGYYQGKIDSNAVGDIRIDLGRLASRLDITVVNETGNPIQKRLGYHFDNVCSSAYFFPIKMGMPPTIGAGITRTIICSGLKDDNTVDEVDNAVTVPDAEFAAGGVHTRYFYVAAHSAKDENEATKLHLFYNRRIVNDTSDETNSIKIPLCNVHPSQAASVANGYSLSRNTRYHFTIRLKTRPETEESSAGEAGSALSTRAVEYGENPGEITVYLP